VEQWLPLAGIVILVLVLWFVWSLTRGRISAVDTPDPDLVRPARPPAPEAASAAPAEPPPAAPAEEERVAAPADGPPDDLTRLKGLGPRLNALLSELGVSRYDQIAAWTPADIARIDAQLGSFRGRIERDGWVEQARLLAAGDVAGFEAKFGKLDGPQG
jgi:predicted flap endonuclease-1-like 5' DNA nuclease